MTSRTWLFLPLLLVLIASCDSILGPGRQAEDLVVLSGDQQVDRVGVTLAQALVLEVRDQDGQPFPGVTIDWDVVLGDASVSPASTVTDDLGQTSVTVTLGSTAGPVEVVASASPERARVFDALALPERAAAIEPAETPVIIDALDASYVLEVDVVDRYGNVLADPPLGWESSTPDVVTVDTAGTLRSVSPGTATLTILSDTARTKVPVTVAQAPASITVTPDELVFTAVGDTARLSAEAFDRNGFFIEGAVFSWSSADTARAVVSDEGLVTSRGGGRVSIVAGAGAAEGEAVVRVEQTAVRMELTPDSLTIRALADTARFTATGYDRNDFPITDAAFEWSSSAPDIVEVDDQGVATARQPGAVRVAAALDGLKAEARAGVEQRADRVALSVADTTLTAIGDTLRLRATAYDRNGYEIDGATFQWSSGDTDVATADSTGTVTARGPGEAEISAAAEDGYMAATIRVEQTPAEITFSPETLRITALEDTARLSATVLDRNGHAIDGVPVLWSSGDTTVAVVDDGGLVTSRRKQAMTSITAATDSASAETEVVVAQEAHRIEVAPTTLSFTAVADTARLTAAAYDRNDFLIEDAALLWSSEDAGIAEVSDQGLVTSRGQGTVAITAAADSAATSATVDVDQVAMEVWFESNGVSFTALEESIAIKASASDSNGYAIADNDFEWSSADESVIQIDTEGIATSKDNGQTVIRAARDGLSAELEAVVSQTVAKVVLAVPTDTLREVGDTLRMHARALDRNGHEIEGTTFNWRSLDTSVVTVDGTGLVSAGGGRGSVNVVASVSGVEDRALVTRIPYGVLVLTFDDAHEDVYTRVFPLLKKHGIRANIALPTGYVGQTIDGAKRLTEAQVRELHDAGWSIVPHSVDHPDLTYLSADELDRELRESQKWVADRGYRGSSVFIVPYHRWYDREATAIKQYFAAARGYGLDHPRNGGMVDWPATDPYLLTSIPANSGLYGNVDGRRQMDEWWAEAVSSGKFLGTYFHSISAGDYAAFEQAMERLLKYKAHIRTYAELFD